ncbi:ABSCISIC ACID-INSENSITIVE 5-like protein 2 [Phoenix dactylifera]|uniref:ABSCISIC ACID-INSENSITIVE 5-like protein 2 n=1 Tax=Phoenix dactylifera TaxID=42345 RepID=A0A8B9AWS9_PHODC|nr:ABSCISIC ACID-INSENSITIVE 5-like protein 2 [Phoenix dactylifera]XP_038988258.1 ABSCISIC ACID-INSENSITIVE 5-like protein 2 [Phoenix dactylifera]
MRIQTMASQGGGGSGGQRSQIQSLARQGSLYSLTLNEVQSHLGEPLVSMNLDELLKSVFPEGNQPMGMDLDTATSQYTSSSGLQRQGSITMPQALSKKTVDELWRDIQQGQQKSNKEQRSGCERQSTLGEMTLEDFLVKAGVVVEGCAKDVNDIMGNVGPVGSANPAAGLQDFGQGAHWLQQYHQMSAMDQHQQGQQSMMGAYVPSCPVPQPLGLGTSPILDAVFPDGQMNISSPRLGALSDPQTPPGRKRAASGDGTDRLVERRQKRMIKNRESAARSRARKQAYTNELEIKVSRLEEENVRLKKQKELEKILFSVPLPEPRYQLRRTSSAPF